MTHLLDLSYNRLRARSTNFLLSQPKRNSDDTLPLYDSQKELELTNPIKSNQILLNKYKFVKEISDGHFSKVFQAYDLEYNIEYAVKIVSKQ